MKKHDSRLLEIHETYYEYMINGDVFDNVKYDNSKFTQYIDSNNFLHNLNGYAWIGTFNNGLYYIHGRGLTKKDWLEEREELLLDEHRKEILNEI